MSLTNDSTSRRVVSSIGSPLLFAFRIGISLLHIALSMLIGCARLRDSSAFGSSTMLGCAYRADFRTMAIAHGS